MGQLPIRFLGYSLDNGVPIYEDNSLSTILTQLQLGQEIPPSLYQAIVEIYVYFLHFDVTGRTAETEERAGGPRGEETT